MAKWTLADTLWGWPEASCGTMTQGSWSRAFIVFCLSENRSCSSGARHRLAWFTQAHCNKKFRFMLLSTFCIGIDLFLFYLLFPIWPRQVCRPVAGDNPTSWVCVYEAFPKGLTGTVETPAWVTRWAWNPPPVRSRTEIQGVATGLPGHIDLRVAPFHKPSGFLSCFFLLNKATLVTSRICHVTTATSTW